MIELNEPLCNKMCKQAQWPPFVVFVLLHNTTLETSKKILVIETNFPFPHCHFLIAVKSIYMCTYLCMHPYVYCLWLANDALPVALNLKLQEKMLSISLK